MTIGQDSNVSTVAWLVDDTEIQRLAAAFATSSATADLEELLAYAVELYTNTPQEEDK